MTDLNVIDAEFTEVTTEQFDYAALDNDTAEQLKEIAEQDMRATAVFWIARAKRLTEAHELLAKNGYGCFEKWVVQEIGVSRFTALRLMDAYKQYSLIVANCNNQNTAEALPQSFYRKLAANDPNAEKIKEEVLAGKIKDSKEYKAALAKIKNLENEKNKDKDSAEKTIQNLKSVLTDTRQQLFDAKEKAKGADEKYLASLKEDAAKARAEAQKANLDYERLQDRFEDLDKKSGDLMRQNEEAMRMLEEIAGELKQSQELNARLMADGKKTDAETDIVVVLATAARQITDENLEACVNHILNLEDGEVILNRFKLITNMAMQK
jgi:hypothetical protein